MFLVLLKTTQNKNASWPESVKIIQNLEMCQYFHLQSSYGYSINMREDQNAQKV